jgi:hypothetical protein
MKVVGSAGFWLLASTTSSELRCNNGGGGDGYIPTGELLGFPHSSSTHFGTVTPSRLAILCYAFVLYGLYLLNFTPCNFVAVKNRSLLCSC